MIPDLTGYELMSQQAEICRRQRVAEWTRAKMPQRGEPRPAGQQNDRPTGENPDIALRE